MDDNKVQPDAGRMTVDESKKLSKHTKKVRNNSESIGEESSKVFKYPTAESLDPTDAAINNSYVTAEEGTEFFEDPKAKRDPLEYPINGTDPGLVVIFNHENFPSTLLKKREGTGKDVKELITTLGRLKYNIDKDFIFKDLTRKEVLQKVKDICAMDLSNRNRLICIFLTHGGENNTLHAKDAPLTVEEFYKPFCQCEHLRGKPKFFLFQACKAEKVKQNLDTVDHGSHEDKKLVSQKTITDDIPEDVLLLYSTIEGEVSMRDPADGTWFIQEFCRNMTAYGRRDDVLSLIIRTTKCVSYGYFNYFKEKDEEKEILIKQLPIFISTLQRKFYITSSKERTFLLEVNDKLKSLQDQIDEFKQRVNELTSA